jgi:transcriptional regulator with XRE-family HTH domain
MARSGPTVLKRRLGGELRRLREESDFTIERVAKNLGFSASKISRIETGRTTATPQDVRTMLQLYSVRGRQQDELVRIAQEARLRTWQHRYQERALRPLIDFESASTSIRIFEPLLVPGLLQTAEYARAVLRALYPRLPSEEISRQVEIRMARQAYLQQDHPPALWIILDEAVICRPVGGVEVMQEQLQHIIGIADRPTITIQVLLFRAGGHAGLDGSFAIHRFANRADPPVVYVENAARDDYLDSEDEVERYMLLFEHLCAAALDPTDTVDLLTRQINEFQSSKPGEMG